MSELIQKHDNRATIRWKLLTGASALALTIASIDMARAEDADRPTIWIELGGQAENVSGQGAPYAPGFLSAYSDSAILQEKVTPLAAQKPPLFSFGEGARISFQPENSDWVFSAGVRIGRSSNGRDVHHQTGKIHYSKYQSGHPAPNDAGQIRYFTQENFVDTAAEHAEHHAVLDFTVGKDVGLGLFGSSSTINAGVRIAQFSSHASVDMRARPDLQWFYYPSVANPNRLNIGPYFHSYHVTMHSTRSFRGVGPTLSWTGSTPFAGNRQNGELTFDWGVNGALLFGRQKADVHHAGYGRYWPRYGFGKYNAAYLVYANQDSDGHRLSKSVTVPNLGGSVGLSWRTENVKVSFGYRADFFFGAMDTGIDAVKKSNATFNGPYASISIGFGD